MCIFGSHSNKITKDQTSTGSSWKVASHPVGAPTEKMYVGMKVYPSSFMGVSCDNT